MSYVKECWIKCDVDGCIAEFNIGLPSAVETREDARKNGWVRKDGKDYCSHHADYTDMSDGVP